MDELLSLARHYRWYVAGSAVLGVVIYKVVTRPRGLPPGPRGWPIIGAIGELSNEFYSDVVRLGDTHGDIFSLYMFGQ